MKNLKKYLSLLLVCVVLMSTMAVCAFAIEHDSYALNGGQVEVDGTADKTIAVTFKKNQGTATLRAFSGYFSIKEAGDTSYLALTALTPAEGITIDPDVQENDKDTGHVSWTKVSGVAVVENAPIWTATYTVDKDTPSGDYTVSLTQLGFTDGTVTDKLSSQSYTATITVTNTNGSTPEPGEGYTVTLEAKKAGNTVSEVTVGDTFDVTVTVTGKAFIGMQGTVSYDSSIFQLTAGSADVFKMENKDGYPSGTTVATLTFEAKAATTAASEIGGAFTVDDYDGFKSRDSVAATVVPCMLIVKAKTFTVSIAEEITHGTVSVKGGETAFASGTSVALIVTPDAGYELQELTVPGTEVSLVNGEYTFDMPAANVTVSAVFAAAYQSITLNPVDGATVTAPEQAKTDETVTFTVTPDAGEEIEQVIVKDKDGAAVDVTYNEATGEYSFTMPAGGVSIEVVLKQVVAPAFTVTTVDEYVTGYTLVTVTGEATDGYAYDGNPMIKVGDKKYAYLVSNYDAEKVTLNTTGTSCGDITAAMPYDVNNTGKVDFNDAGAAFGCYNVSYLVNAENMAMYLRADVNGDNKVDGTDVSVIMSHYTA